MVIKLSKNGKFLSCKRFPKCTGARTIDGKELEGPKETGEICPEDGGKLVERDGKFGRFVACSNYPKCKFIKRSAEEEAKAKTGTMCPQCLSTRDLPKGDKTGEIVERRGRFGPFFSCSNYPKCNFAMKSRPTGKTCDLCNSLMMQGTKTIPERCSNKLCEKHQPGRKSTKKSEKI
jgi:DNA topoisomerase-1